MQFLEAEAALFGFDPCPFQDRPRLPCLSSKDQDLAHAQSGVDSPSAILGVGKDCSGLDKGFPGLPKLS